MKTTNLITKLLVFLTLSVFVTSYSQRVLAEVDTYLQQHSATDYMSKVAESSVKKSSKKTKISKRKRTILLSTLLPLSAYLLYRENDSSNNSNFPSYPLISLSNIGTFSDPVPSSLVSSPSGLPNFAGISSSLTRQVTPVTNEGGVSQPIAPPAPSAACAESVDSLTTYSTSPVITIPLRAYGEVCAYERFSYINSPRYTSFRTYRQDLKLVLQSTYLSATSHMPDRELRVQADIYRKQLPAALASVLQLDDIYDEAHAGVTTYDVNARSMLVSTPNNGSLASRSIVETQVLFECPAGVTCTGTSGLRTPRDGFFVVNKQNIPLWPSYYSLFLDSTSPYVGTGHDLRCDNGSVIDYYIAFQLAAAACHGNTILVSPAGDQNSNQPELFFPYEGPGVTKAEATTYSEYTEAMVDYAIEHSAWIVVPGITFFNNLARDSIDSLEVLYNLSSPDVFYGTYALNNNSNHCGIVKRICIAGVLVGDLVDGVVYFGTNFASAQIAMGILNIAAHWPDLTKSEVYNIIFACTRKLGTAADPTNPQPDDVFGQGVLAYRCLLEPNGELKTTDSLKTLAGGISLADSSISGTITALDSFGRNFELTPGARSGTNFNQSMFSRTDTDVFLSKKVKFKLRLPKSLNSNNFWFAYGLSFDLAKYLQLSVINVYEPNSVAGIRGSGSFTVGSGFSQVLELSSQFPISKRVCGSAVARIQDSQLHSAAAGSLVTSLESRQVQYELGIKLSNVKQASCHDRPVFSQHAASFLDLTAKLVYTSGNEGNILVNNTRLDVVPVSSTGLVVGLSYTW